MSDIYYSASMLGRLRRMLKCASPTVRGGRRVRWFGAIAASCLLTATSSASVESDCRPAGNIAPGLLKLIHEFQSIDHSGAAPPSVLDFLVGVSKIQTKDLAALEARGEVKIVTKGYAQGTLNNDGQSGLQFEGMFAGRRTFFRVPQRIQAQFQSKPDSLIIFYDAHDALELGETLPLFDIPIFLAVNHVKITPNKLLFYWGANSGDDADRCYVAD